MRSLIPFAKETYMFASCFMKLDITFLIMFGKKIIIGILLANKVTFSSRNTLVLSKYGFFNKPSKFSMHISSISIAILSSGTQCIITYQERIKNLMILFSIYFQQILLSLIQCKAQGVGIPGEKTPLAEWKPVQVGQLINRNIVISRSKIF